MSHSSAPPPEQPVAATEQYLAHVTGCQSALYAFICSLLGNSESARDVLQETNLVLWKKAAEFDPSREFKAWAYKIAYMQVLAFRKQQSRDRLIFDDDVLDSVAQEIIARDESLDQNLRKLDDCIRKLPPPLRRAVQMRYGDGQSVKSIAAQLKQNANAVAVMLYRARQALIGA